VISNQSEGATDTMIWKLQLGSSAARAAHVLRRRLPLRSKLKQIHEATGATAAKNSTIGLGALHKTRQ
jgi:hypothetical protein